MYSLDPGDTQAMKEWKLLANALQKVTDTMGAPQAIKNACRLGAAEGQIEAAIAKCRRQVAKAAPRIIPGDG